MVFTSFGIYPELELNHKVILFLIFWGTTILFATVLHHFAFPPTTYTSSNFPISLPTFTISSLFGDFFVFDSSHLNGCEMLPHCGFDLHSLMITHPSSAQSCPTLWFPGLQPTRLLCPWDFPGKNTGVVAISSSRAPSWPGTASPSPALQGDSLPLELYWANFHVHNSYFCIFFGEISIHILCPLFSWTVFCYCWVVVLFIFWILIFWDIWLADIFSHSAAFWFYWLHFLTHILM